MAVNVFVTEPMSNRVSASTERAGLHVAQPVPLHQGDLPVGDDRHGNAGDLFLIEVGLQNLRDALGQGGRRRQVCPTKLDRGHEQTRIECLSLGPCPWSRTPTRPIGRAGWAGPWL